MNTFLAKSAKAVRQFFPWFAACHFVFAVLTVVVFSFVVRLLVVPLYQLLNSIFSPWSAPPSDRYPDAAIIVTLLVVAPLLESLIFQMLIFRLAAKVGLFPCKPWLTVAISAVLFGAAHYYNAGYVIIMVANGLVLAGAFWLTGAASRAYWIITVAHALTNAVALIVRLLSG